MNKFTTFLGLRFILPCFKQLVLNSSLYLELFIYLSFGERLWFAVIRDLIFVFENSSDSHSTDVTVKPAGILKFLQIGWNIQNFSESSLPN